VRPRVSERSLTSDYLLDVDVEPGPAGERLRAETERGASRLDRVVDESRPGQPLVGLDRVRRLHDTAHQTVDRLARVRRELSPVHDTSPADRDNTLTPPP